MSEKKSPRKRKTVERKAQQDRDLIEPKTRNELRSWLKANHLSSPGVWVALIKKGAGIPRVDLEELCEELVCFGWVDSRPAKLDTTRSRLLCTPRSPKSAWSRLNKQRYERMETQKKLAPAGRQAKKLALENGQWNALDDVEKLLIPIDLKVELGRFPKALSNFDAFPPSVKRGILEWITQAKRTDTRVSRIKETAELAAVNKRANQWPRQ